MFCVRQNHRLTAHRELIEKTLNEVNAVEASSHVGKSVETKEGNDNLAFVNDRAKRPNQKERDQSDKSGQPIIHFPQPPAGSPTSRLFILFE